MATAAGKQHNKMKTRLAQLIAKEEGFGLAGKIPTLRNNPGDLRHSPHSQHPSDPNAVGTIGTLEDGWADLERQLKLYASRGMTIRDCIYQYAPPNENNSGQYLGFICHGLGCGPDALVSDALRIPALS